MSGETNLNTLIKQLTPILNEGVFVYVTVKDLSEIDRNDTVAEFQEKEGTTLILEKEKADSLELSYEYLASWITLNVHSSLEGVGLTALIATELAKHHISCNMVAGYYHDHLFVNVKDGNRAFNILQKLSKGNI